MYLKYFKLNSKPFQVKVDLKFLWLGEKHKEALSTLRQGVEKGLGSLLLTGEEGTGKTIIANHLTTLIDMNTMVATLPHPDLGSMEFFNLLADSLKMNRTFDSKGAFFIHLRDFLHQSYANQQKVLIIIDECQRLNHRLIEDVHLLSNIELHDRKLINILFLGRPEFNDILKASPNKALSEKIKVRYHLEPLEQSDIDAYVKHRLKVAGSSNPIFKKSAFKEVFKFSGGIPRLINIICDHTLLTAHARRVDKIDDRIVDDCATELRIPAYMSRTEASNLSSKVDPEHKEATISPVGPSDATTEMVGQRGKASDAGHSMPFGDAAEPMRSPVWKVAYVAMVLLLIAIAGFAITHFASEERPRWDAEDLTPKKYKTSLEKEKELLASRLENGDTPKNEDALRFGKDLETADKDTRLVKGDAPSDSTDQGNILESSAADVLPEKSFESGDLSPVAAAPPTISAGGGEIEPLPLINEKIGEKIADKILIQFSINSNDIEADAYPVLDRIADYLVHNPDEKVQVRGYTDTSGSPGYNESVSRFRANAVKSYLIGKGASADNIEIFAMGAQNPIGSNDTLQGRRRNRRVEVQFAYH